MHRRVAEVCSDQSATIRRLIEDGLMTRPSGVYSLTESGETVWRVEHYVMEHYQE